MTEHHPHHEYIYKAIIALNNAGVYLIEHGLYFEAVETLKDSIRFMNESFFSNEKNIPTVISDQSKCNCALQAAWRRKSLVRDMMEETNGTNRISIVVVSDQDHPSKVYDILVRQCCTSFCCVTIDPVPSFDDVGSNVDQLQQDSALMLYNLGIAFRCLAVTHRPIVGIATSSKAARNRIAVTTSVSVYLEHFSMSFHLLELSNSILRTMLHELSVRGVVLVNISLNLLLASTIVLFNLKQMSDENVFLFDKHIRYSSDLQHIVTAIAKRYCMMMGEGENQMLLRAPAA